MLDAGFGSIQRICSGLFQKFLVLYDLYKSLPPSIHPFFTGSVPQWLERATLAKCILLQSIRQTVVAYQNPESASKQEDKPRRQTEAFGRNTVCFFCPLKTRK